MFRKAMLYLGLGPDDEYEDDLGDADGRYANGPQRPVARPVPPAESSVRAQPAPPAGRPGSQARSTVSRTQPPGRPSQPSRSGGGMFSRPDADPSVTAVPADRPRSTPRPVTTRGGTRLPSAPPDNEPSPVRPITPDTGPKPNPVVRQVPAAAKPFVVSPENFNQAQEVGDRFRSSQPVILNLQDVDRDLARRLIDFSSGLCYGLGGNMEKVAPSVYLLSPHDVEITSDERRRLHERGLHDA